jgi:diguanylate cyclase (GGDEF)-like protein
MKLDARTLLDVADPAARLRRDTKLARLLPFGLLMVLPFAFIPITGTRVQAAPLAAAGGLMIVIAATTALPRWESLDRRVRFVPVLGCLVVVALLRQATTGGGTSMAIGVLPLVPVLWAALYESPRALLVGVAGVAAMFIVPILLIGPPRYTEADWAKATLWTLGALLIGVTVQRLVLTIKRQSEALERMARTDSLTGLPNHRAWEESLDREVARARRRGDPLVLAMVDLDHLKRVNDAHGHQAGSAAIREAGLAWHAQVRDTDVLARFGGDEFGLILVDATEEDAMVVAERVREATPGVMTCSVGVAAWDGRESGSDLFIRADVALYEAKRLGRDRVAVAPLKSDAAPAENRHVVELHRANPPRGGDAKLEVSHLTRDSSAVSS